MIDRGLRHCMRLKPGSRPEMEILDQAGLPSLEFRLQQLSEQAVIAVPFTAAVEGDHQQIPAFHPFKDAAGFLLNQDRIAKRSAHPVQHRSAGKE
jgi:hypothetical protein